MILDLASVAQNDTVANRMVGDKSGSIIVCKFCQHETDLSKSEFQGVVHTKRYNQKKSWLTGPWEKKEKEKATVEQDCQNPKCDSRQLYFSTA